jgi:uncharacterized tellurite resistance protein B-like protein
VNPLSLTDNDKTAYLANLWLIARADKALSEREEALIEEVRKNLSAKRSLATAAQKAAEGGTFSLTRVGSFANQVQNLEDMVAVALADSDLEKGEADMIAAFCGLIGIRQDQLDLITSDVSKRLKNEASKISCSKCGAQIQSDARFCPTCGAAVASATTESTPLDFSVPKDGYAITFCESSAAGFVAALELARGFGGIQTALKNKKTWYLIPIGQDRFGDVMQMAKALSGIRNRAIYRDGQQMDWDELFGFVWCASQRDQAYKPVEYCFGKDENRINPWGCKQVRLDWSDWSSWFSLGHWERIGVLSKRNVWVFDKARIRHNIATNIHRFRFCPYLHETFVEAVVLSIPEKVEISDNGPWKYNAVYEETPGSIKITEREGEGNFSFTREYYADGVRPRGLLPLKEILARAFSISKTKPAISPQDLLTK